MKTIFSFKSLVALGLSLLVSATAMSCAIEFSGSISRVEGSGVEATRSGTLSPYNQLDVWSNVNVQFVIGEDYRYTLTADSAVIDLYQVSLNGSHLRVGTKTGANIRLKSNSPETSLVLTVPGYDAFSNLSVDISGASKIVIPEFSMSDLKIDCSGASRTTVNGTKVSGKIYSDCSGASRLDANDVASAEFECDCSGASSARIIGTTQKFYCDCSGASNVTSSDLKVKDYARYDCSGASKVTTGDLTDVLVDFEASGASNISYQGAPRIQSMETSGASRIKK